MSATGCPDGQLIPVHGSRTWTAFSRRGISCSRLMASSIPARALSIHHFPRRQYADRPGNQRPYTWTATFPPTIRQSPVCHRLLHIRPVLWSWQASAMRRIRTLIRAASRYARMSNRFPSASASRSAILISRIDMLFGFTRIQRRHVRDFSEASSPTASRIVCDRPEKASTGTRRHFPHTVRYQPLPFHSPAPQPALSAFPGRGLPKTIWLAYTILNEPRFPHFVTAQCLPFLPLCCVTLAIHRMRV